MSIFTVGDDARPGAIAEALYAVGHWLIGAERFEDGKYVLRSMLRTAPEDDRGWIALAFSHERTGELEKSRRLLSLACQACPGSGLAALSHARFLERIGRSTEAERAFDEAAERAEQAGDDDLVAAIAAERLGQ